MIHAIVMAGGSGTRFWPRSRRRLPKQLLTIVGEKSMIQYTAHRLEPIVPASRLWIVTGASLVPTVRRHLPEVPRNQLLGEPVGRNTAPCLALALAHLAAKDPDAVAVVCPADHLITDEAAFRRVVSRGADLARRHDAIVLVGIEPTGPESGYGYIKVGSPVDPAKKAPCHRVGGFVEKPAPKKAASMLASGGYLWNSGMFIGTVATFRNRFATHLPEIAAAIDRLSPMIGRRGYRAALEEIYSAMPAESIDYGIMEKDRGALVLRCDFGWSDVGSWRTLHQILPGDAGGNVASGRVILRDTAKSLVLGEPHRLVAVLGMERVIVIDTKDALLICPMDRDQEVKEIVSEIARRGDEDYT